MSIIMSILYFLMIILEDGINYLFSFGTALLIVIIINTSLALFVFSNAKSRELDNCKVWALLTGLFGIPIAVFYLLMNLKLGVKNNDKNQKKFQKNALIICAAAIALSSVCYPIYKYEDGKAVLKYRYENSYHMPYISEDGSQYLFYDKMGKEYDYIDEYTIPYYTPDGIKLIEEVDETEGLDDAYSHSNYISKYNKTIIPEEKAAINLDGYLIEIDKNNLKKDEISTYGDSEDDWEQYDTYKYAYYDKNGNLYFEPKDCSWDKDGNLVFRSKSLTEYVKQHKKK